MIFIFFLQLSYLSTIYIMENLLWDSEIQAVIFTEDPLQCIKFFEEEGKVGRFRIDEFSNDMAVAIAKWEKRCACMKGHISEKSVCFPFQFPETIETKLSLPPKKTYFLKYFKNPALAPEYELREPVTNVAMEVCGNYTVNIRLIGEDYIFPVLYTGAFVLNNYITYYMIYNIGHCDLLWFGFFLAKRGFLMLKKVEIVVQKLLRTAVYLQHQNVAHADIKPQNVVLVCENREPLQQNDVLTVWECDPKQLFVKFIDFECARQVPYQVTSGSCDTLAYRAPELFFDWIPTLESETWSLAITIIYLLTNKISRLFFKDFEFFRYIELVSGESIAEQLKEFSFKTYPPEFQSFETKKKRGEFRNDKKMLNLEEKIKNPLLLDLLKKMLRINPKNRINFKQIKEHPFFNQEE